ncbi:MAG: DUF3592 domain-containing protein [Acidobacteriota bacterium]
MSFSRNLPPGDRNRKDGDRPSRRAWRRQRASAEPTGEGLDQDASASSSEAAGGRRKKSSASNRSGFGCLLLFALPFAAAGAVTGWMVVNTVLEHREMQSWLAVEARVLEANLEVYTDEDSTTYEATATYEYVLNDQRYEGTRVGLHGGADNLGSFHQDVYEELQRAVDLGEPVEAWVDPEDAESSVIYRDLRWGALGFLGLFSLLFGGVGFGMMIAVLVGSRRLQQETGRKLRHPDQPWLWKEEWAGGVLRSQSSIGALAFFTFFWNAISLPVTFFLPKMVFEDGESIAALFFLFPLVGVLMIATLIYSLLRRRKYGTSELRLATFPAVLGSSFGGIVEISKQLDPPEGFHIHLACLEQRRSSSGGKSKSSAEKAVWEAEQVINRDMLASDRSRTAIPVYFDLPSEERPSSDEPGETRVFWRLTVSAAVPGVDYQGKFEVPVFPAGTEVTGTPISREKIATYLEPLDREAALQRAGAVVRSVGSDRLSVVLGAGRNLGYALTNTAGWLLWLAATAAVIYFSAPWLFSAVMILVLLLWSWSLVDGWLRRTELSVDSFSVLRRRSLLFWSSEEERGREEIQQIESRKGDTQMGALSYYDLVLLTRSAEELVLISRLPSKNAADAIGERVAAVLGLEEEEDGTDGLEGSIP